MKGRIASRSVSIVLLALGFLGGCTSWFGPSIDFAAATMEGPAPLIVEFTPVADDSIVSCTWSFGDGETSDAVAPVHVYRTAGTYTVSLTAEFVDGNSGDIVPN